MNFEHTEERRALADSLNRFIADRNPIDRRHAAAASELGFSRSTWNGFAELGAIGALFSEAVGGYGGSGFDIAVVFDALGRGLVVEPLLGSLMAGHALSAAHDPAHEALIASLAAGSLIAGLAHEEAAADRLSHVGTRAVRRADGWTLSGTKCMVRQAEAMSMFVVSARQVDRAEAPDLDIDGDIDDEAGISLFAVPAAAPGVSVRGLQAIDGGRLGEIVLDGVRLDESALIGKPGDGHAALERGVGAGLLALCAEAVGAMDVAREVTLGYLQTRQQFGVPIGSFQALQHRMATLALEIEQARSAVINAAAAFEGPDRQARERALSAAKFSIGRIGTLVAEECIQLHGGIGMTWELPLPHYAKRLVMIDHQLGDEDFHLQRYIGLASKGLPGERARRSPK